MNLTYLKYEILRTFRNRRFFIFSLIFPLIVFLLIAGGQRHAKNFDSTGISLPTYFMVGMAGFGAMAASISGGARIATERVSGWNRQLRLTPLTVRNYFRTKVLTSYMMALLSILLLYAAGLSLGVSMTIPHWASMTGLILVALAPFAALGIVAGHLLTPDSIGPAMGGATGLIAMLGGAFGPIATKGTLLSIIKLLPSYWLVQSGAVALGGRSWPNEGWIVIAAWTLALAVIASRVYQRDTRRV
ncbi:MAG TPA: ABC transporter permease [Actinomycetota bacterium]|nr:ABC transporter permease [Actinomycetota bacterium]